MKISQDTFLTHPQVGSVVLGQFNLLQNIVEK
jgi:hypothetical protein